ncbi:hypothetical protein SSX86_029909 [Deinandra increscens subsp. villosa]|uniref:Reverse transcriptase zinc-binding domain-containing protein n=1 Tax=Deinandra increscens subsp. villosa TaxID=3103831 RepID=A0AAP0CB24_9ASTR
MRKKIGNGVTVNFWEDVWLGDSNFKTRFNRLFYLTSNKSCSVSSVLQSGEAQWAWRRPVRDGLESAQLADLENLLRGYVLNEDQDSWAWDFNGSSNFAVRDIRNHLDNHNLLTAPHSTRWISVIPKKVNIFSWRLFLDRLPTRWNISKSGMEIDSISCVICHHHAESTEHLFGDFFSKRYFHGG